MEYSLYYSNVEQKDFMDDFISKMKEYSERSLDPIYIINKPLGEKKYVYSYEKAIVLLVPKHKIIILNFGKNDDAFNDYCDDFFEDLGYISDKYAYIEILGRPRKWRDDFSVQIQYDKIKSKTMDDFLVDYKLSSKESERKGEFIISLLTGSINDINKIGGEYPQYILDKIKKKIILFDGEQTRFIFDEPKRKRITIQGLAGTGKTELLLHKIKELYTKEENTKIVFTCHNKILAENLRVRIPEFFNFMKVDEQIKWNERLWVISSWGSKDYKDSGVYSYICTHYNIPFYRYSYNTTFDAVCRKALLELETIENFEPCFDHILIDESQDFSEGFFKLCEKVAKSWVYVAGDIFQNVFDNEIISKVSPDFLLNKCYRTDPRTLMCAHAMGMGLFEKKLRWLDDNEWEACGYVINKQEGHYRLSRKPLRRFEDLENSGTNSIELIQTQQHKFAAEIINIIDKIIKNNPTVEPDDIGIMFLENVGENYALANQLQVMVKEKFDWDVNIGYETKVKRKGTLFVSNRNNVKGLEFPFIICIMQSALSADLQIRNSIYMMLTRSFLTSYFIIPAINNEYASNIVSGIDNVNRNGYLLVKEPSKPEKIQLRNAIINNINVNKSQYDLVEEIMDQIGVVKKSRSKLHKIVELMCKDQFDKEKIYDVIQSNYNLM